MADLGKTCEECGGNFSRHYAECSRFAQSLPYHGIFFDGASHPVDAFVLEQEAERHAKKISGGAPYEIKPVLIWIQKPE
ncbi:MAG: hypothetical protein DMF64_19000 [Acidobacteria bacterium]|nr:MAG: hypothetical protein DMF64_19000 [Acidobacteriota bacterium]